ncbi:hypothetical protein OGAPHI_004662 [Ogataea philodendri]|uniref:Auxin efflux carrier n=1 Tax=Ogataea philodendri TaxID=1378263 RepID=A0A9P8T2L2_9ASCO|nr:uncharacterized protein OGAPHI_004662 [Ogataea philodendri]KAH3663948.1 hypothetical protein OGAPHI_004662 [Ogataea philodendri]
MRSLGAIIFIAFRPIIKIYLILAVGFILARKNILTIDTSRNISYIVVSVLSPCLNFAKVVTYLDNSYIRQIGTIAISSCLVFPGQALATFAFGILAGSPRAWWGGMFLCGMLPNISDLPIAYVQSLASADIFSNTDLGVAYICIYGAVMNLIQFNLGGYRIVGFDFPDTHLSGFRPDPEKQVVSKGNSTITATCSTAGTNGREETDSLRSHAIESLDSNEDNASIQPDCIESPLRGVHRTKSVIDSIYHNRDKNVSKEGLNDIVKVYSKFNDNTDKKIEPSSTVSTAHENSYKHYLSEFMSTFISNATTPASISTVLSLVVSMIPWVKAIFVTTHQAHIHSAPDGQPPLKFLMDFVEYLGQAQVPLGLLLLGGTIGRLKVTEVPQGIWKTVLALVCFRLFIFPIIGCAFNSKLHSDGLFYGDKLLYFISNITYCLPPATSVLYFTAFYSPSDTLQTLQMNILALVYIAHYVCLIVCLPFVASYTLKISLDV